MNTVFAQQQGIFPNTGEDSTKIFAKMLRENPKHTTFILQDGRYDFFSENAWQKECYLSNSDIINPHNLSIELSKMEDIVFDGGGAQFVFHGQTMPFTIHKSKKITLRNLTIDWDIPLIAEGCVIQAQKDFIDVKIDSALYPHEVVNDKLWFVGENWRESVWDWGNTEFDSSTGKVAFEKGDTFPKTTQQLLPDGTIRFLGNFKMIPKLGNIIVLRHGNRIHAGIFIQNSNDITIENVTLYGTGGLGILAQFSETLTFHRVQILPNREKNRCFVSGHDDGIHLSANSGIIRVEECSFLGLMDDPLNLHGIAAKLEMLIDEQTIQGRFMHCQSKGFEEWAKPGHIISFLDAQDMHVLTQAHVQTFKLQTAETFLITFDKPISREVQIGVSLENLSRTASLICKNNYFGSCRARGILFCTPKSVLVENNIFESAGAAILIAGDASTWYESGGSCGVMIRNNYFSDCCLTSNYLGGEGIISIHPELPSPKEEYPYHRNIYIEDNVFQTSDAHVLYALCTWGLHFCGNRIVRSYTYPARNVNEKVLTFEHCTNVQVLDNMLVGSVVGRYTEMIEERMCYESD